MSEWEMEVASQMMGYDTFDDVPAEYWDEAAEIADDLDDEL